MGSGPCIILVDNGSEDRLSIARAVEAAFPEARLRGAGSLESLQDALAYKDADVVITTPHLEWAEESVVRDVVAVYCPDCPVVRFDGCVGKTPADEAAAAVFESGGKPAAPAQEPLRGAVQVVLDRQRDRLLLQESEERYRRFFHETAAANLITLPDGTLLECNPAYCALFGFSSAVEALDEPFSALFGAADAWEAFLSTLSQKGAVDLFEIELRRKGRRPVPVLLNAVAGVDANGRVREIRAYIQDISERKKLEAQFLQSQKMEALGRLAGGIAHDFNNIITAINGYAELLLIGLGERHPMAGEVAEIRKAGERSVELTRQLLSFSRVRPRQMITVEVNRVLRDIETMIRRLIGEDISLEVNLSPDAGCISADPGQLEQIVMNLVINARDAMPTGGTLRIESGCFLLDADSSRTWINLTPGFSSYLSFTDTGCGMTEEVLAHLFEPFFTTKEKGKGTGLGLSTVYGIVKGFGGHITAQSELSRGSLFKVYFPRIETEEDTAGAVVQGVKAGDFGHESILLVEDEDMVRKLTSRLLKEKGYRVFTASNFEEALQISRRYEGVIHLLITDVVLKGKGGGQLAQALRNERTRLRVLFVSGYSDTIVTRDRILFPGAEFLEKPFTLESLARKVRSLLDGGLDDSRG